MKKHPKTEQKRHFLFLKFQILSGSESIFAYFLQRFHGQKFASCQIMQFGRFSMLILSKCLIFCVKSFSNALISHIQIKIIQ